MNAEVTELAGPGGRRDPARTASRHGSDDGTVTLADDCLSAARARTVGADAHEIAVESYATFASTDLLAEHVVLGCWPGCPPAATRPGAF